ncbi:DEAD/DEAH box helicase [Caldalkalibacillus salinus]|uniref:DEAD/DEAH box helicase n=1 Tax=Caldalkalibacillus salinus TaxID=2803787 RepID=UPI001924DF8A|nr:DEAD/DEAH box helicase [Caldalkalibacillus salinus]
MYFIPTLMQYRSDSQIPIRSRMVELYQQTFETEVEQPLDPLEREQLNFEYELEFFQARRRIHFAHRVELKMRVGVGRLYVVKDIEAFLTALLEREPYTFSDRFSYEPDKHVLSNEDKKVAEYILTLYRIQENDALYISNRQENKRGFPIPDVAMKELIQHLHGQTLVVTTASDQRRHVHIQELDHSYLFSFHLRKRKAGRDTLLTLENAANYVFTYASYHTLLHQDTLYTLSEKQAKQLEMIGSQLQRNNVIDTIPPSDLEDFCSYVLPNLRQIGQVSLHESLAANLETEPLQAVLHLAMNDHVLEGQVTFRYGQHERNPFSHEVHRDSPTIIARDVEKEGLILSLLSHTAFTTRSGKLYLSGWENIFYFIVENLPRLQHEMEVYMTKEVRQILVTPSTPPSVSMDIDTDTHWLDLSFSIDGIPDEELVPLLKAMQSNAKYYRLASGSFVPLQHEQFKPLSDVLDTISPADQNIQKDMSVPLYHAFTLDPEGAGKRISGRLHRLLTDIDKPAFSDHPVPESLQADLRDYQVAGFRWLKTLSHYGLGGILADDMGLGKTVQTIAYLLSEVEAKNDFQALIICPASLVYHWEKEIHRFAPRLNVRVVAGTKDARQEALSTTDNMDVWITSYPLMQRDVDLYHAMLFTTLILDEAQAIKNEATKTTKAVRAIRTQKVYALSGTPIENQIDEIYTLFETLMPGILGSKQKFKNLSHKEIAKRVRPFILRRLKSDVLTELPDKMESVQYTDLTTEQKKLYVAQVKQLTKEIDDAVTTNKFQERRMEILAGLTRLRQICCHPALVLEEGQTYGSGKLERLLEYVHDALAAGQRIVIFSQFTSMLSIIKEAFDQREWSYYYLDGQTPSKERVALADKFNNGGKALFLISLKAGGTGLNLIGGDTVILYDTWWNPAVEDQAADRVYRYGQTKNVQVIKLISNGTIEEKILALHEKKKALVEEIIQPGDTTLHSLSADDIKALLATDETTFN